MTPLPQETASSVLENQNGGLTGEEIVISGISGIFPKSNNLKEFRDNLYNKVDMVSEDDGTKFNHAELPQYMGKISGIEKFDAHFFRVTEKQARSMDPACRKMMEQAYCAMFDAGVNPLIYKGKKVGVYTCALFAEPMEEIYQNNIHNNFVISGMSKNMIANRVSYWLDAKGPSYHTESGLGAILCLEQACNNIADGICEAAIIGGVEFTSDDVVSVNLRRAGLLCLDGKTKCFDKNGDGCARSQGIGVLFLQKAKDAKRIYAEVHKVGIQYGLETGAKFNQTREPEKIVHFLKNIYSEIGVSPDEVEYVEANGAAIPEADSNELQAISNIFGENKTVKVGSVKSNMGSSEAFVGISAIAKICFAYQNGQLAGNLHYEDPLDIPAIKENRVQVLTENIKFNRGIAVVNSFPYDGSNGHLVFKGHYKQKNKNANKSDIPRLVLVSGRHKKGLQKVFDLLKSKPIDQEFLGLLNSIYQVDTPGYTCRGYTIIDTKDGETKSLTQSTEYYQGTRRPLWFVYSGMGSQWPEMGTELMRIPTFANAIEKCSKILEPKGVDLVQILTSSDKTIFDNVLNSFVGIAAVQIGLTDILKKMGLVPDFIIGHSLGEMGCAYCDGCFSIEEMILTAYARGLASIRTKLIKGSMAAVGLGYADILPLCPPEIDIACRNSYEFCTISGPVDAMKIFVDDLTAKGVFAKEVPTGNIAFHSRYIQTAGPKYLKELKKVLKNPLKRSEKWISTSFPEKKRDDPIALLSSAEYHANNLLSPVYFEEAARQIPNDAVVVEVAAHGLMQAILKRSHPKCTHIPLTKRAHKNPLEFLFKAFGQLYQEGYDLKTDVLYPKIEYPVSTETDLLSHFVDFYHVEDWYTDIYIKHKRAEKTFVPSRTLLISLEDEDFKYLAGHVRGGDIVFPEAGVLFYVWETLAMYKGVNYKEISVSFHDVQFYAEIIVDRKNTVNLKFCINKGNHYFEVKHNDVMIANGKIYLLEVIHKFIKADKNEKDIPKHTQISQNDVQIGIETDENNMALVSDDIYEMMKVRGHHYKNEFQSIYSSSSQWELSQIKFSGNWLIFLDSLIQLNSLVRDQKGFSRLKLIKEIIINMADHTKHLEGGNPILNAEFSKLYGRTTCGGVTISQIFFEDKPEVDYTTDKLKTMSFRPHDFQEPDQEEDELSNDEINYKLISTKTNGVKSLKWIEIKTNLEKTVKVYFAAPSLRDVQNYIGLLSPKKEFGMDFSGIDNKGNKVMGLVAEGALASTVEPDQNLLWPVPDHWSLDEAATIPLPYAQAFYCLLIRYRLIPGQTVFVTGGAGALGQAVISISLSVGCTVYTCVSDIRKKQFLRRLFPDLDENNIGYSQDISFLNMVICNTNNKRCNVVINCASGQTREFATKCVGNLSYFIDISDYDMKQNKHFHMWYLVNDKNYKVVDLSCLFRPEYAAEKKILHRMISKGIATGTVRPISYVVYSTEDVDRAFRLLTLSRHRGRALIRFSDPDTPTTLIPRMTYTSNGAYVVVCNGQMEQGIHLINHLIERGARNVIFNQQSKKLTGYLKSQIATWKDLGATVTVSTANLESKKNCVLILRIETQINGIFVIQPNIKKEANSNIMENTLISLIDNLDDTSRNNCPKLKYFVILASNSKDHVDQETEKLKQICEKRLQSGLPALLVLTETIADSEHNMNKNTSGVSSQSVIKAMETGLKRNSTFALAYNKSEVTSVFLEEIARIMGIEHIDAIDENLRIKDLVCYEINFEEIKDAIKECCKIDLSVDYIRNMNMRSLKNSYNSLVKKVTRFDSNMAAFFNFVEKDEIDATDTFFPMITMTTWAEGEENLNAKATNLLLLPGFEGHHQIFKPLCEKIKMRATTIQIGPDFSNDKIHAIALELKQKIEKKFVLEPKFYLLGYSFGVNLALEVAALLEKDGLVGVVYCLDSSPDAIRVHLNAYLGKISEEQLQNAIIKHLFYVISEKTCESLEIDIQKINNWNKKVAKFVEKLSEHVNHSKEYLKGVIEAFYNRIKLSKLYDPKFKLESKIVLLKGIPHPNADYLLPDYGLSKYAINPVEVVPIYSDFASAPYDSVVAALVNRFLDPALLEEFRSKNVCERYTK